jgi:SM-20-related protein
MGYLNYGSIERTPLQRGPFEHVIVPNCLSAEALTNIGADFPPVPGPGSHPPSELNIRGHFAALLDELDGDPFRYAVESKFGVDLYQRPTMCTVRGYVQKKDGGIHTDSKTKIITVLLYLNESWTHDEGRLRLLRNGTDLEDYFAEIPPNNGTLLMFRRSDNSWHGHKPYEGPRRAIQFNWVTNSEVVRKEQARHRLSTRVKYLKSFVLGSASPVKSDQVRT